MATPFLSSEEYDERAHRLYDQGDYETALEMLKEGIRLYPGSVDLHIGLGYTRLARDEFVWAKQSFEHALVLDNEHEDALVGLGEAVLRFGRRAQALHLFRRARDTGCGEDVELLLSMGRALYRERLFEDAKEVFAEASSQHRENAEAAAALGYTLHRLGDESSARKELRRALQIDPAHHEARIYLGHLLYDSSDWAGALKEFERVGAAEHWDTLALWRLIELKRALTGVERGSPSLAAWEARLEELESEVDPLDGLLAELDGTDVEEVHREHRGRRETDFTFETHRVRLPDGRRLSGSWLEIVRQICDVQGQAGESVAQFMRRHADEERVRSGLAIPSSEAEAFVQACARAGHWQIET
jgi:Tfp pilus assembly protein PilF